METFISVIFVVALIIVLPFAVITIFYQPQIAYYKYKKRKQEKKNAETLHYKCLNCNTLYEAEAYEEFKHCVRCQTRLTVQVPI